MNVVALVALVSLAQSPSPTLDERAVIAAEKSAEAAQRAADAAQKSAEALQKMAELEAQEKAVPPAKPADAPKTAPSLWSGGASVGLSYLTGNANSISFSGAGNIQRKSDRWILAAKIFGGYGENTLTAGTGAQTVALYTGLVAQVDLRIIEKISIIAAGGIDTDHVKGVEFRGYGELGVGVMWIDWKAEDYQKMLLRTDITFRIQNETRYNYFPTASAPCSVVHNSDGTEALGPDGATIARCTEAPALLVAPRAALTFKYALTKATTFSEEFEVMPNVVGAPRVILNSTTKLTVHVWENVGIGASFALKYDSSPAPGKATLDTATLGTIEAIF